MPDLLPLSTAGKIRKDKEQRKSVILIAVWYIKASKITSFSLMSIKMDPFKII